MKMQKVKRCGHCGSQSVAFVAYAGKRWRIQCDGCGAAGGVRATKAVALSCWNQRYELGASPEAYIQPEENKQVALARFLSQHPVAKALGPEQLALALDLATDHENIRVYRSRGEIIISRDAMHSSFREPFILRGIGEAKA